MGLGDFLFFKALELQSGIASVAQGIKNTADGIAMDAQFFKNDVIDGSVGELEGINGRIKELYEETQGLIEKTNKNYSQAIEELNGQRKTVSKTTLKSFADTFSTLKNVSLEYKSLNSADGKYIVEKVDAYTVNHRIGVSDVLLDAGGLVAGGVIGGVAGGAVGLGVAWFAREMRLMDEIEEAKEQLGELKEQCAEIRRKCVQVESLTRFLDTTHQAIDYLSKFCKEYVFELQKAIDIYGEDYLTYPKEIRELVKSAYNHNMALHYFIHQEVFTPSGRIKKNYQKYIEGISKNRNETKSYLEQEPFYLEK